MKICDVCHVHTGKVTRADYMLALEGREQDEEFALCAEHLDGVRRWIVTPPAKPSRAQQILGLPNNRKRGIGSNLEA